jgi:hypothetical protein
MSHSRLFWCLLVLFSFWGTGRTLGKIQFDVFPGYEGRYARAGAWYPVAFEIFNDGPSFDGVVEVSDVQASGYMVRIPIELPSNTKKVFTTTLFCSTAGSHLIDARLRDERGKIRDERLGQKLDVSTWEGTLLGGLPGAFSGMPTFPETSRSTDEFQAIAPRLSPEFFPDSALALEALNCVYLNTATALKLREPQIDALLAWLHGGGHLIVGVDQPADLNALTWLRLELPARVSDGQNLRVGQMLNDWVLGMAGSESVGESGFGRPVKSPGDAQKTGEEQQQQPSNIYRTSRNQPVPRRKAPPEDAYGKLPGDPGMSSSEVPVYGLRLNLGQVLLQSGNGSAGTPLIVTHIRDRGRVTLLAFNPEREPIKSWKLRPWFWARLAGIPGTALTPSSDVHFGGSSLDGLFGAMIETRQVRKLPVGALLMLLVAYLVVIGPMDHWILRKLGRPMLTWITFPCYVVLFSGLIYFIGWKLRAGKAEWNELHLVDLVPQALEGRGALRGRTYTSLYSPANDSYPVGLDSTTGLVRPESRGLFEAGTVTPKRTVILQKPKGISTELGVDIWTSQLNVFDWHDYTTVPLTGKLNSSSNWIHLDNLSDHKITRIWVVKEGQIHELGALTPHRGSDFDLSAATNLPLRAFIAARKPRLAEAINLRGQAFGANDRTHIDEWPESSIVASFAGMLAPEELEGRGYIAPPGLDLTPLAQRGDTVVFAWMPDTSLIRPIPHFETPRFQKNTLLRWVIPRAGSATR